MDVVQQLSQALKRDGVASSDFDLNPKIKLPPGRKLRQAVCWWGFNRGAMAPR